MKTASSIMRFTCHGLEDSFFSFLKLDCKENLNCYATIISEFSINYILSQWLVAVLLVSKSHTPLLKIRPIFSLDPRLSYSLTCFTTQTSSTLSHEMILFGINIASIILNISYNSAIYTYRLNSDLINFNQHNLSVPNGDQTLAFMLLVRNFPSPLLFSFPLLFTLDSWAFQSISC